MKRTLLIIPGVNRGSDKFALRLAKGLNKNYDYEFTIIGRWFDKDLHGIKYWLYNINGDRVYGWFEDEGDKIIEFIKKNDPYDLINIHTATIVLDGDLDKILEVTRNPPVVFVPHGSFVVRAFYREFLPYKDRFERAPKETLDNLLQKGAKPDHYEKGGKYVEQELKEWWGRPENKHLLEAMTYEDKNFPSPWQKWWLLGFFYDLEKKAVEQSDKIIHVSDWIKNMYDTLYGNTHIGKSAVILDGIHYTELMRDPTVREEVERRKKFYENLYNHKSNIRIWYIFIGAFAPEKGIFDLLKAYEIIRKRRNDVGLILIGGTTNPKILQYIEDAGRKIGHVHIYSPNYNTKLDDESLAGLLLALNSLNKGVYVHPAWIEDFGLAPVEAAYFGLPVITYDHDGPREIIIKNGLGVGVDPYNINELVERMEEVGDNIQSFKNDDKNSFIENKFSFNRVIKEYHGVFSFV